MADMTTLHTEGDEGKDGGDGGRPGKQRRRPPRINRFAGVLRPRLVGAGAPEVSVLVLYDVENDKIRNRISDVCLNYGLERVQYSAFLGKINRNHRQELILQIQDEIGDELARIRVIPITEDAMAEMWVLDHYANPVSLPATLKADGAVDLPRGQKTPVESSSRPPKLRIISSTD